MLATRRGLLPLPLAGEGWGGGASISERRWFDAVGQTDAIGRILYVRML
jgi:hypothetical protein